MTGDLAQHPVIGTPTLRQARVVQIDKDGAILVAFPCSDSEVTCIRLETGQPFPLPLMPGDEVLVWQADSELRWGVVLGRLTSRAAQGAAADELVLEARTSLTLKVGDGSITIREDGKILIKGKDLVSHAQRANRIKGGSVEIN
jgi:hypothetical protein